MRISIHDSATVLWHNGRVRATRSANMLMDATLNDTEAPRPPFLYEIQVNARLSPDQWTGWFDHLTVAETQSGSALRGSAEDHAALYGILARLRDLAVPLVSVKVLDADAQRRLAARGRQLDLLMTGLLVALYLVLLGGLVTVTVFIAPVINTALALTLLFAALGGLAYGFSIWSGHRPWRWLAYFLFVATTITFLVTIAVSDLLPPPLGIAITLFLLAAGLVYALGFVRRWRDTLRDRIASDITGDHLD
jgi:hypothetical protein